MCLLQAGLDSIRNIARVLPHILVEARIVLNREQAHAACETGAKFLVSPGLNAALIGWAQENHVPMIPGAVAGLTDAGSVMNRRSASARVIPGPAALSMYRSPRTASAATKDGGKRGFILPLVLQAWKARSHNAVSTISLDSPVGI